MITLVEPRQISKVWALQVKALQNFLIDLSLRNQAKNLGGMAAKIWNHWYMAQKGVVACASQIGSNSE